MASPVEADEATPADVITLTKEQLDEAIKTAVATAVGQAVAELPKASIKPTSAGQIVAQHKRKIPSHMKQPIFQPDTLVKLIESSERNWTWRALDEWDEAPSEGTKTMKRRQNNRIITWVKEYSALHNLVGTVTDLPASTLHEKEWLVPVNWPGEGVDSVPESEIVPSYS